MVMLKSDIDTFTPELACAVNLLAELSTVPAFMKHVVEIDTVAKEEQT